MAAAAMDLEPLVGSAEFAESLEAGSRIPSQPAPQGCRRGLKLAVAGTVAAALVLAGVETHSAWTGSGQAQAPSSFNTLMQAYRDAVTTAAAGKQYDEKIATAMSVLAKVAYCDGKPGMYGSAAYSCGNTGLPGVVTSCEKAGFVVVPGSVRTAAEPGTPGAPAFVARVRPSIEKSGGKKAPPQDLKAYTLVFRGSLNSTADADRDLNTTLVPLEGFSGKLLCPKARVHAGYYDSWRSIRTEVLSQLHELGAFITCTGHGSGAALCSYAMLELKALGFQVMGSYVFSMPAPGDATFSTCFNQAFGGLTPVFRLTNAKDLSCALPSAEYKHVGAEVHYTNAATNAHQICVDGDENCGCASYSKDVKWRDSDTCQSALVPEGSFCFFGSYDATCYGGTGFQWSAFGPSQGGKPEPAVVGITNPAGPRPTDPPQPTPQPTPAAAAADKPSTTKSTTTNKMQGLIKNLTALKDMLDQNKVKPSHRR